MRFLGRTLLVLVVLVAVAAGAAALFTRTDRFRTITRDRLNALLADTFRGEVAVGRIEGSVWSDLLLVDVSLRYEGADLVRIPHVRLSYALSTLLGGRLRIDRLALLEPTIRMHRREDGTWNLLEALSAKTPAAPEPEEGGGLPIGIGLDSIRIHDGTLLATTAGPEVARYEIREVALDGAAEIGAAGTTAEVEMLALRLIAGDRPPVAVKASLAYEGLEKRSTVAIRRLTAATDSSRAELQATVRDFDAPVVDAALRLDPLAAGDVAAFAPGAAPASDLSAVVRAKGPLHDLAAELDARIAGGTIEGRATADVAGDPLRVDGTVGIRDLDLKTLLAREDLAGVLTASVTMKGTPASPATLEGRAEIGLEGGSFGEWRIASATAEGELHEGKALIAARIEDAAGTATLDGTVGFAGKPTYEMKLEASRLNPAAALPAGRPLEGDLNLVATVEGDGVELAAMRNRIRVTVAPSRLGSVAIREGKLVAEVADERLRIETLSLRTADSTLSARGAAGLRPDGPIEASWSIDVGDLGPWLALAGTEGSGAFAFDGSARGTRASLGVRGTIGARGMRFADTSVGSGRVALDLEGVGATPVHGSVTAALADVEAGMRFRAIDLRASLPEDAPQKVRIVTDLEEEKEGRSHHLEATATLEAAALAVRLTDVSLELPDGRWTLPAAATVRAADDAVTIEGFRLVSGARSIRIDGSASRSGAQDLRLAIDRFSLAALRPLLGEETGIDGALSADAAVAGTAAAPVLSLRATLDDLRVAEQSYDGATADVSYRDGLGRLGVELRQDATHRLEARGEVPVAVAWSPAWSFAPTGPMDVRLRSDGIDLAVLNAVGGETIAEAGGVLALDVTVQGPISDPSPRGTASIRDGRVRVVPLGVTWTAISADAALDPEALRLTELTATSGDEGTLRAEATVPVDPGARPIDATVRLRDWQAIDTNAYQARLDGDVRAAGPLSALHVTGALEVVNGTIRPDLDFLGNQPPKRDETIVFVGAVPEPVLPEEEPPETADAPRPDVYQNLTLDLAIDVTRNTWIKHDAATVELRGDLDVGKRPGEEPTIGGRIETVRGWVNFQGRRFTITDGEIVLTGGEAIDPALDVVARYTVRSYKIFVVIGGTAQSPTLELRSEPSLEQADILSVLLFGRPTEELNDGERGELQDRAASLATSYAVSEVSRSVTKALGVEEAGIQIEEVSERRIAVGKYVTERTYVSVGQTFGAEEGREVSLEYEITPSWSFVTSSTSTGNNGADVIWYKRY